MVAASEVRADRKLPGWLMGQETLIAGSGLIICGLINDMPMPLHLFLVGCGALMILIGNSAQAPVAKDHGLIWFDGWRRHTVCWDSIAWACRLTESAHERSGQVLLVGLLETGDRLSIPLGADGADAVVAQIYRALARTRWARSQLQHPGSANCSRHAHSINNVFSCLRADANHPLIHSSTTSLSN